MVIYGTSLLNATEVTFNGVSTTFSVEADGAHVHATVPDGATTGPIAVTTPGGTAATSMDFIVKDPVPIRLSLFRLE